MVTLTNILFGNRKSWGAELIAPSRLRGAHRNPGAIGLRSPSSGSVVIYSSPEEWYDESPASPSLSPATKKRRHDELEKDINELTSDIDILSGPEGKTPSELDAIIADYHHKVKDSRMQAIIRRREETAKYI